MNQKQLEQMKNGKGFIAALDQSGGSTPRALAAYGIPEDRYSNDEEMFDLVHEMRSRIIKDEAFSSKKILAAILFEQTMDRKIDGQATGDYLWNVKGVVPFVKIDQGLAEKADGVQLMKEMTKLDSLLERANKHAIFGTKMRSVIHEANEKGIKAIVAQQFEIARRVLDAGMMPIIEPEVNIKSADKEQSEELLKKAIFAELDKLKEGEMIMLKLSIPTKPDFYRDLIEDKRVLRVVALSGGYSRDEANELLKKNKGLIASFSRALAEDLRDQLSGEEFHKTLQAAVDSIYEASIA